MFAKVPHTKTCLTYMMYTRADIPFVVGTLVVKCEQCKTIGFSFLKSIQFCFFGGFFWCCCCC